MSARVSDDARTAPGPNDARVALEARWFVLTRATLPALARARGWPIALDHCFQRVLLDNACGGRWTDTIARPAYRNAPVDLLERALALGEEVVARAADLDALNDRSLRWRGKR